MNGNLRDSGAPYAADMASAEIPNPRPPRRRDVVLTAVAVLALATVAGFAALPRGDGPGAASGLVEPSRSDITVSAPAVASSAAPRVTPPPTKARPAPRGAVLPATTAPPTTAARQVLTYRLAVNVMTPQLKNGSCVYRVIYGNYGDAAIAFVHFYAGTCVGTRLWVAAARGEAVTYENTQAPDLTDGSDSCGTYQKIGAIGDGAAIAVGLRVRFGETGDTVDFLHDRGGSPPAYRTC